MLRCRHSRLGYLYTLWQQGVWAQWIAVGWTLIGAAVLFRDELLSTEWQAKMKLPAVIGLLRWQDWAIVLLLIVIAGLLEASYRAHREEQGARERAEARLVEEGSIRLSIDPGSVLIQDPPGRLRQVARASVHNDTGKSIDTVLLQAVLATPEGREYHYQLCEPFPMLVDQTLRKDIGEYNLDDERRLILPVFWKQVEGRWIREPGGLAVDNGAVITIQAISSSTRAVRLKLIANFSANHWRFDFPR